MSADDLLVEGREFGCSPVPAIAVDRFVRQIRTLAQSLERGSQTRFVFKDQVWNGGQPGECVGHFIARPMIGPAQDPIRFDQNQISNEKRGPLPVEHAQDLLELRFVVLREESYEHVGIKCGHALARVTRFPAMVVDWKMYPLTAKPAVFRWNELTGAIHEKTLRTDRNWVSHIKPGIPSILRSGRIK